MSADLSPVCRECGSKCCRYFCFQIDEPDDFAEFDDLRWYLLHEGVTLHIDGGDWYISIANRCKALAEDGNCRIYADRPVICRKYSTDNCDFTGGDYGYDQYFETPEDIEKYAMKVLGQKAYLKAKAKAHAKHARKEARREAKEARRDKKRRKRKHKRRAKAS